MHQTHPPSDAQKQGRWSDEATTTEAQGMVLVVLLELLLAVARPSHPHLVRSGLGVSPLGL